MATKAERKIFLKTIKKRESDDDFLVHFPNGEFNKTIFLYNKSLYGHKTYRLIYYKINLKKEDITEEVWVEKTGRYGPYKKKETRFVRSFTKRNLIYYFKFEDKITFIEIDINDIKGCDNKLEVKKITEYIPEDRDYLFVKSGGNKKEFFGYNKSYFGNKIVKFKTLYEDFAFTDTPDINGNIYFNCTCGHYLEAASKNILDLIKNSFTNKDYNHKEVPKGLFSNNKINNFKNECQGSNENYQVSSGWCEPGKGSFAMVYNDNFPDKIGYAVKIREESYYRNEEEIFALLTPRNDGELEKLKIQLGRITVTRSGKIDECEEIDKIYNAYKSIEASKVLENIDYMTDDLINLIKQY